MKKPSEKISISKACNKHAGISEARKKRAGISLVEILISLSIFSVGIIGLYLSIQSMNKSLQVSMQRDVEAAYANMLISEVNPYHINVETIYDTVASTKEFVDLPDQRRIWYLRRVDSDALSADVKNIHIYFYRNQGDAVAAPYRHFKRELPLNMAYNMADIAVFEEPCKEMSGQVWISMPDTQVYDLDPGERRAGLDTTAMGGGASDYLQTGGQNGGVVTGSIDTMDSGTNCFKHIVWRDGHYPAVGTDLVYKFPVTENQNYTITLGFSEGDNVNVTAATHRMVNIVINTTTVASNVDVFAEVGYYSALTRTYTGKGVLEDPDAGGPNPAVPVITVRVNKSASSVRGARVSWIMLSRS